MKSRELNKKPNILLLICLAVPISTFVSATLLDLQIHNYRDKNILPPWDILNSLSNILFSLSVLLPMACIAFFVVCLAYLKNKKVPLHKKLIAAGLNIVAFLYATYVVGSHF